MSPALEKDETKGTIPIFKSFYENVKTMYQTPEEMDRVNQILRVAEEQSLKKEIRLTRKPNVLRKMLVRWDVRFRYGIHWAKPFYPVRLIRNYALTRIYQLLGLHKHVFRGIEFGLTFNCNFRCNHCLCSRIDESDTRKEMTPQEYGDVCRQAMKMGALTFGLEGGEPFVYKEWEKVIEELQPHYNHIEISTNGYLIDEKIAKKCADLGVDTLNISLDSGIPELHDVFRRRKGSFERVMRATELCKKYRMKVILNTTVHAGNLYTDGFIKLMEFAEKEKFLINFLFAKSVGSFKDMQAMLAPKDFDNFWKITEPYDYWHIHHMGPLKSNHGGEGCSGTKEFINMTPYGDVINCANNHVYLGNVREEPLKKILHRAIKESPFGRYRPCFLTRDPDFMNVYYPLLEDKGYVTLEEFKVALRDYEKKHNKKVYPELV